MGNFHLFNATCLVLSVYKLLPMNQCKEQQYNYQNQAYSATLTRLGLEKTEWVIWNDQSKDTGNTARATECRQNPTRQKHFFKAQHRRLKR
jgi:hypothetical protein